MKKNKYAITGVDIGGTSINIAAINVDERGRIYEKLFIEELDTPKIKSAPFYDFIADLIRKIQTKITEKGIYALPVTGIGHPGRFIERDGATVIAPEATFNLGPDGKGTDFRGINPAEALGKRLNQYVIVKNDAIAQMAAALKDLLKDKMFKELLLGERVAYIGPGTGLGGGFAKISKNGQIEFFTDGHIYDLLLEEGQTLRVSVDGRKIDISVNNAAEDAYSGRAVRTLAKAVDEELIKKEKKPIFSPLVGGNIDHVGVRLLRERILEQQESYKADVRRASAAAKTIVEFEGRIEGQIIELIYKGKIRKRTKDANWPEEDKNKVKGIRNYILAGSVATKGKFARIMHDKAYEYLSEHLPGIKFNLIPIKIESAEAGAIGAALFIPASRIKEEIGSIGKIC